MSAESRHQIVDADEPHALQPPAQMYNELIHDLYDANSKTCEELRGSLDCLQQFALAMTATDITLPTEAVVKQSYRLQLNLMTLFADERAGLSRTLHRLLLWHWHDGMPLRSEHRALLLHACSLLTSGVDRTSADQRRAVAHCHNALLRQLLLCRRQNRNALRLSAAGQGNSALPVMLAQGFSTLMDNSRQHFVSAAAFQEVVQRFSDELQMLEQGAARLRLDSIETLASVLLCSFQWLQQAPCDSDELEMLSSAHQNLQRMLNQAAAWHAIEPADDCVARIEQWLEQRGQAMGIVVHSGMDMTAEQLLLNTRRFVQYLCALMDLRLHFYCQYSTEQKTACPLPVQVLDSIQHVLRFIVLERLDTVDGRRRLGKPAVPTLRLQLGVTQQNVAVCVEDDAMGRGLSRRLRQRLERKCGSQLTIESVPGRSSRYRWEMTLSPGTDVPGESAAAVSVPT